MQKDLLISSILEKGWFYSDHFIDDALCDNLMNELKLLPLRAAKIGRSHQEVNNLEIRNDTIHWLEAGKSHSQDLYLKKIDGLMTVFNRELFLGLRQFEGHFAHYKLNGFYKKHLDQFNKNSERLISVVTYLNSVESGGELRIYNKNQIDKIDVDLIPKAGRLVCFLSNQIYHEVRPTQNDRYSIAGWMRTTIP